MIGANYTVAREALIANAYNLLIGYDQPSVEHQQIMMDGCPNHTNQSKLIDAENSIKIQLIVKVYINKGIGTYIITQL